MGLKSRLYVWLGVKDKDFKKGMKSAEKTTSDFGKNIKKIGGYLAAAFGTQQLLSFGRELLDIGLKAKNVRKAFANLNDPNLLKNLRAATGGTVSDLELMQRAVQAKNLGLPLQQLATYFKFATIRAAETGESVDYLVNSIVTGIGRKSVMIMDNLGISSVALQEEVEKVGDFATAAGNIIERELGNASITIDEAAKATDRLAASWENFKLKVGEWLADENTVKALDALADFAQNGDVTNLIPSWSQLAKKATIVGAVIDNYYQKYKKILNLWTGGAVPGWSDPMIGNPPSGTGSNAATPSVRNTQGDITGLSSITGLSGGVPKEMEASYQLLKNYNEEITDLSIAIRDMPKELPLDFDGINQHLEETTRNVLDLSYALEGALEQAIVMAASAIGELVGGASGADVLNNFVSGLAGIMMQFGELLIAQGVAIEAAKNVENGYVAIAAGIALVAISAAVQSSLGNVQSYAEGGGSGYTPSYGSGYTGTGSYSYGSSSTDVPDEIILKAKGSDLVGVLSLQNNKQYYNG